MSAIFGDVGADTLQGGAGNDTIAGGPAADPPSDTGADSLLGLGGADSLAGFGGADTLAGGAGDDTLDGGDGDDLLFGDAGRDLLRGGLGADTLIAGAVGGVNDTLRGEAGDDLLRGREAADAAQFFVNLVGGAGADTIMGFGRTYNLADYSEAAGPLTADLGAGAATRAGEADLLVLVTGLRATAFDDTILGTAGADFLFLGTGSDYADAGDGIDTLVYQDAAGGVFVDLLAGAATDAGGGADTVLGFEAVFGGNAGDTLLGGEGDDVINGQAGADRLDGRGGYDVVQFGGAFGLPPSQGAVADLGAGTATDSFGFADTLAGFEAAHGTPLADDLKGVDLGGLATSNLRGLAGADTLRGTGPDSDVAADYRQDPGGVRVNLGPVAAVLLGVNLASGRARDGFVSTDTLVDIQRVIGSSFGDAMIGSVRGDQLSGLDGADTLDGGEGDDTLNGGSGADRLTGGLGNDVLVLAGRVASDPQPAAGAVADLATGIVANDGFGHAETIAGFEALTGTALADTLSGDGGGNTLDGGEGADSLAGGGGNDLYRVDAAGDLVFDSGGADTVLASASYALPGNIEALILTGAALTGSGNGLDNLLRGNAGANTLNGASGNDTLDGAEGDDTLLGGNGNDSLLGGDGADSLNGGAGADTMAGGAGNDSYVLDGPQDVMVDSGGVDTVVTPFSFQLAGGFENLVLTGAGTISGTGNGLANAITGNNAANVLAGSGGNDSLVGLGGADVLNGGAGADTVAGGVGADRYVVDNIDDVVIELPGEGTDQVSTAISWTLGENIENLVLTGSGDVGGFGNTLANRLVGNGGANPLLGFEGKDLLLGEAGADTLYGGAAADRLTGGAGGDVFYYAAPSEGGDVVTDFSAVDDAFAFVGAAFGGLPPGVITGANFVSHASNASTAPAGTPDFVHNTITGALFFDADGQGGAAGVKIATMSGAPIFDYTDIIIV